MAQTCILILGMHRSGTSALSGTLNILDVYLGSNLMDPKAENPKGFFENNLLFEINEKLLKKIGSSVHDDFFNEKKLDAIQETNELEKIITQEFKHSNFFAIKDPRIGYLLPIYIKALNNLNIDIKVIIPFRNPIEVADSLKTRNNFSQEKGLLHWAYHHLLSEKFSRGLPRVFTSFNELVDSPEKVIGLIDQKLDLDLMVKHEQKKNEVRDFLTLGLMHHNVSIDNLSEKVPGVIRDIIKLIPDLNEKDLTKQLDGLRNQLFDYQSLFYNYDILKVIGDLEQFRERLHTKDEKLIQARQGLQTKVKELEQVKQGLQAQDTEIEQAKQRLQAKVTELEQVEQELQGKVEELTQARQGLQTKDKELEQSRQGLQTKVEELVQARQGLQTKEQELKQAKQGLQAKDKELEQIKRELISMYLCKSWKIMRPLRRAKRFLRFKK